VTTLSFERELNPGNGAIAIDTSRPFNILWAYGPITAPAAAGWGAIGYHGRAAGAFSVNMQSQGNCDAATRASLQPAPAPTSSHTHKATPKKGVTPPKKAAPKKAAPKKAPCAVGQTVCTSALQAQGLNCILNTCVHYSTAVPVATVCSAGQTLCTASLAAEYSCIVGKCFYVPAVPAPTTRVPAVPAPTTRVPAVTTTACANGLTMCTMDLQAQGANCVVGACFTMACANGLTMCTTALQAQGANCIVGACFAMGG